MQVTSLLITSKPEISAIYFALLQCGYDFYALEKSSELTSKLESFRTEQIPLQCRFFSSTKQKTCEVYPFWPRAALLEEATFYLDDRNSGFADFNQFYSRVASAANISSEEKGSELWNWMSDFPASIHSVLGSSTFQSYLNWEQGWIAEQNLVFREELERLQAILNQCVKMYGSPAQGVHVLLNPIKCAYSSDYFTVNKQLFFSSGQFRLESVVHEFLHPILHWYVIKNDSAILRFHGGFPDLDASYLFDKSNSGRLNAAEEYLVRKLTADILCGIFPDDLNRYILDQVAMLSFI